MRFSLSPLTPLTARLPAAARPVLAALALAAWLGATIAIARGHLWIGAGLGAAGLVLEGLGGEAAWPPLALFLPAFGFALFDPSRAIAAMFVVTALAVLVSEKRAVGIVKIGVGAAYVAACLLPDYFSLLAYLIGIACFVLAGRGEMRR